MPANVETAAYADTPAWHGIGRVVQGALKTAEVLELAGLDWSVTKKALYCRQGDRMVKLDGTDPELPVDYGLFRSTDGRPLATGLGRLYQPIQNVAAVDFMDSLVASGDFGFEAAGSLEHGKIVWLLGRIPKELTIGSSKDVTYPYLVLTNNHDGHACCHVFPTAVRVVCMNTLQAAFWSRDRHLTVRIPHVGDISQKITAARQVLGLSLDIFKLYGESMNMLADVDGLPLLEPFLNTLFPPRLPGEDKRRDEKVQDIRAGFRREEQSAFGLLNAVTAWVDHTRLPVTTRGGRSGPKDERVMKSALLGSGADLKSQAVELLLDMAHITERVQAQQDALKVRVRAAQR
jgi:phage/plasmid-like protein (TIGR03299 family)